jgi:ribokinase
MLHVIGNAAIDTIFRVDRFPLPGETVAARSVSEDLGGKGANQAVVAARAGAKVRLVAAVGDDTAGARIRDALQTEGVIVDGLVTAPVPTDRSSIYVDADGENTIVSVTEAAARFDPLAAGALADVGRDDTVLCQGNLAVEALIACLSAARERGAVAVLNPSPVFATRDFDWRLASIIVLNAVEAVELGGTDDCYDAARRLRAAGAGTVVVTLGAEGAVAIADEEIRVPSPTVKALDTTGAGDVFCGVLTALRVRGLPWRRALAAAAGAAAICVTRRGVMASFPTADEIRLIVANQMAGSS